MEDRIRQLYQELLLEHNRCPRNFGKLHKYTNYCVGYNPFCGDKILVYMNILEDAVKEVMFEGEGCAISKSAASIITQRIKGKSLTEVKSILEQYQRLIVHEELTAEEKKGLGDLEIFSGVWQYPSRSKCALLCSKAIETAIEKKQECSTE